LFASWKRDSVIDILVEPMVTACHGVEYCLIELNIVCDIFLTGSLSCLCIANIFEEGGELAPRSREVSFLSDPPAKALLPRFVVIEWRWPLDFYDKVDFS